MAVPTVSYERFYTYQAMMAFVEQLAASRPEWVRVTELLVSPGGLAVPLLEITDHRGGDPADRPGYLLHANIHAHELTTTTVALAIAADLAAGAGTDPAITDLLGRVVFYIVPRLCPDGAEEAVGRGGSVRSRNHPVPGPNRLRQEDVDGDGRIAWMRWLDPDGDLVALPEDPRLLVRREPGDAGPFYRMLAEGRIEDYDGGEIGSADRRVDFNRQWPASWQPESIQPGAGDFAFAEPEMEAIGRFIIAHPNIFAMLGLHTGGNGILRPSATVDDTELPTADVDLMKEFGTAGAERCGFALYSVREYCRTYSADARLRGHFTDWAYQHRGAFTFEIELGNLHNSAGLTTDAWQAATPAERERVHAETLRWSEENDYPSFLPWRPFDHPDLGPVELGGWLRPQLANPSLLDLPPIAEGCSRFVQDHAALAPRLELRVAAKAVGQLVWRIRATVVNRGGLSTRIVEAAQRLAHAEGVELSLQEAAGVGLLSRHRRQKVGHLRRVTGRAEVEWFVQASPGREVVVEARGARAGRVSQTLTLGAE